MTKHYTDEDWDAYLDGIDAYMDGKSFYHHVPEYHSITQKDAWKAGFLKARELGA